MAAYEELTNTQLLALPTHRLYTIYQLYRQNSYYLNYHEDEESGEGYRMRRASVDDACKFIKAELDKRGHIPRKDKSKETHPDKHLSGRSYWEELSLRRGYEPAQPRQGSIKNPEDAVGLQVYKKSKKPFKSKNIYNTVKFTIIVK